MVTGGLLIVQGLFFPDPFSTLSVTEVEASEIKPDYSIDPKDVVDGIHVPSGLIADDGFEIVFHVCGKCHSIDLVKQNRSTEEGWKEMIVWMQETQGLWDLGEDELPIIKYLAKNYAPKNTGRRKNLENIQWYDLKDPD
jgi:hypothetical protein